MATKVLVFESDAVFAGELRSELGKLGCTSQVVDDGNLGLQQAASDKPDLILLSIELPRMNGFSVCNKLKKDAALRDVPLIIMSSESSEETFEQHRKLRTRAEDYVHKPIAFGELLRHIQNFVRIEPPRSAASSQEAIVIDDEIGAGVVLEDDDDGGTIVAKRPQELLTSRPKRQDLPPVNAEDAAFADEAFGRITGESMLPGAVTAPPPHSNAGEYTDDQTVVHRGPISSRFTSNPNNGFGGDSSLSRTGERVSSSVPPPLPAHGFAPRPSFVDRGAEKEELARLRGDLEKARARAAEIERELSQAKDDATKLRDEAQRSSRSDGDSQKLQRENDELRAKLAAQERPSNLPQASTVPSSREVLNLREALNKKDKELLSLREAMSRKDREIVEEKDRALELERGKADIEDKVLATETELADARDRVAVLEGDREQAKKAGDDLRGRLAKVQADLDTRAQQLDDARAKHAEAVAGHEMRAGEAKRSHEAALESAQTAHAQALADLREEKERAVADANAERERALADLGEKRVAEFEAALAESKARGEAAKNEALDAQREASAAKLAHELAVADAKLRNELSAAEALRAAQVDAVRRESDEMLAASQVDRDAKLAAMAAEHAESIANLEHQRDQKIAEIERVREDGVAERARAVVETRETVEREAEERATQVDAEHRQRISAIEQDRDIRIASVESKAARDLADARSVAEAQKGEADQRISELETDLLTTRGELADANDAKRNSDAKNSQEIAELAEKLRQMTESRDAAERELQRARDRVVALELEGSGLRGDLDDTRKRLTDETRRAEHAFTKWESDKGSLERAKDALAVALAQIEDAEARSIHA